LKQVALVPKLQLLPFVKALKQHAQALIPNEDSSLTVSKRRRLQPPQPPNQMI